MPQGLGWKISSTPSPAYYGSRSWKTTSTGYVADVWWHTDRRRGGRRAKARDGRSPRPRDIPPAITWHTLLLPRKRGETRQHTHTRSSISKNEKEGKKKRGQRVLYLGHLTDYWIARGGTWLAPRRSCEWPRAAFMINTCVRVSARKLLRYVLEQHFSSISLALRCLPYYL